MEEPESMYGFLLALHNWGRWAIIIAGVLAIIAALRARNSSATTGADKTALIFMIIADLQLLVGLVLYFVSPFVQTFLAAPGEAMGDSGLRYWGLEHALVMVIAIALVHVGRIAGRKAPTPAKKYGRMAIWFAVALVLMLVMTPWPFMSNFRPLFRF
jgi:uncharacterized membrane protein